MLNYPFSYPMGAGCFIQLRTVASLILFASLRKIFRRIISVSRRRFTAANLSELTNSRKEKGNHTELTRFKFIYWFGTGI